MGKTYPARARSMYFRGQQQSEEFARGAWAARDSMAKLQAHSPAKWSCEELTAMHVDEFSDNAAKGGDYGRGFVTAMVEFAAFEHCVGSSNMDVWRPLQMDLRFTARGSHPTLGSKLYKLDGKAVSVAPDSTVYSWHDNENRIERSAAFFDRVQKRGSLISQRAFAKLRGKPSAEERERAIAAVARMNAGRAAKKALGKAAAI